MSPTIAVARLKVALHTVVHTVERAGTFTSRSPRLVEAEYRLCRMLPNADDMKRHNQLSQDPRSKVTRECGSIDTPQDSIRTVRASTVVLIKPSR